MKHVHCLWSWRDRLVPAGARRVADSCVFRHGEGGEGDKNTASQLFSIHDQGLRTLIGMKDLGGICFESTDIGGLMFPQATLVYAIPDQLSFIRAVGTLGCSAENVARMKQNRLTRNLRTQLCDHHSE